VKLVSDSPLRVGWLPWQFSPGDWRLVVAVKATVELPREGVASLAEEQAFVTGDLFWDDDPERSLAYAEDLALIKPRGEVWITGTVRAPEPVRELSCLARVGDVQVRFSVVGDRWWRADGGQTEPEPFTEMPLCWERCFGGPRFEANPVGRGIEPDPDDPQGRVTLPNIERHGRLIRSPGERPEPAGAWPIPRTWPERMRHLGREYGSAYLRDRWPYFPGDFSWTYFQAAREAQRIDGFWRGDELLELASLHPRHRRVRCALPGIKPRVFVYERATARGQLREVGLVLDTVAIDAGEGRAHLVWRGASPCAGEELAELSHLYLTHEALGQPRRASEYVEAFVARLEAMWEEEHGFEAQERPAPPAAPVRAPEPPRVDAPSPEQPASLEEQMVERRRQAIELGVPEPVADVLFAVPEPAEAPAPDVLRAALEASARAASELGFDGAAEALREALDVTAPAEPAADRQRPEPPRGLWTSQELRDEVQRRVEVGEPLARLQLTGADLSLMDLSGQDLSSSILLRADLSHATLDGARLDGATLDEARLEGASLRGASLRGATLSLAEASGADFTGAALVEASAERAIMDAALFDRIDAAGFELEESYCVGASFVGARLVEAELARSNFDEANFRGATLDDARFEGASLRRTCLDQVQGARLRASDGADLSEAAVRWSELAGSTFADSICIGTRFTESTLTKASFAGTRLEGAELLAVSARGASFDGARMAGVSLAGADLLGARFEGADLRLADLSGANAFSAEFWNAVTDEARLDGANLEGTKLR